MASHTACPAPYRPGEKRMVWGVSRLTTEGMWRKRMTEVFLKKAGLDGLVGPWETNDEQSTNPAAGTIPGPLVQLRSRILPPTTNTMARGSSCWGESGAFSGSRTAALDSGVDWIHCRQWKVGHDQVPGPQGVRPVYLLVYFGPDQPQHPRTSAPPHFAHVLPAVMTRPPRQKRPAKKVDGFCLLISSMIVFVQPTHDWSGAETNVSHLKTWSTDTMVNPSRIAHSRRFSAHRSCCRPNAYWTWCPHAPAACLLQ
jgi:hypothetical protein